jgi:hypothetical protein
VGTIVILVLNSLNLFQNMPSLDTVKDKIDHVTSDKYTINTSKSAISKVNGNGKLIDTNSSTGSSTNANLILNNDNTLNTVYQLLPKYVDRQNYTGQVFEKTGNTCGISIPAMAQDVNGQKELTHVIQLGKCSLDVGDPVQITTLTAKPDAPKVNPSSGMQITPYSRDGGSPLPDHYNVVQLTTVNQGKYAMLNFDDSSGKTKSVTVIMRNSDTVLFNGTFFSSKFNAQVKNVPNTPYIIEMTIDNAIYGILHASAYAPSNAQNSTTITGILSQ